MTKIIKPEDKRRAKRRPILDTFSLFISIPRKGPHRLKVHDVSELGIGFDFDIEGEPNSDFQPQKGQQMEIHLYLNQSLFIPLTVEVARVDTQGRLRRVGAEFAQTKERPYRAFTAFLTALDVLAEVAEIPKE